MSAYFYIVFYSLFIVMYTESSSINQPSTEIKQVENFINGTQMSLDVTQKVKLSLFYGALCPYSAEFIHSQLVPTYKKYKDFINLDLVPYGDSKDSFVDGVLQFECHNGPKECAANLIHACAVNQHQNEDTSRLLELIKCLTNSKDQEKSLFECADKAKINYVRLNSCFKTDEGKQLLSAFGNRNLEFSPKLEDFPAFVFNNVFDFDDNEVAYNFLQKVICKIVPATCSL